MLFLRSLAFIQRPKRLRVEGVHVTTPLAAAVLRKRQLHVRVYLHHDVHLITRRTLMDAHTRPSHSGMIARPSGQTTCTSSSHPFRNNYNHHHHHNNNNSNHHSNHNVWTLIATRAIMAAGLVHVVTTYGLDITLCEGPSMDPTLKNVGEIILLEKFFFGRNLLASGEERALQAMKRQEEYWKQQCQQQSKNNTSTILSDEVWHQQYISVTDLPSPTWRQAVQHLVAPLAVGDVVVVQHPSRRGTVCKRILGLPGDQVLLADLSTTGLTATSRMRRRSQHLHPQQLHIVPDGHVWLEGDNPANSSDSRSYGPIPVALVVGKVVARIWPLRGDAWMKRGAPPKHDYEHVTATASTVLPAGYGGQHILTSLSNHNDGSRKDGNKKQDETAQREK